VMHHPHGCSCTNAASLCLLNAKNHS
jgi:hypothetical protein